MKKLIVLFSSILLGGCFSNLSNDVCPYCLKEKYTMIARYQKTHSLGKTDSEQRWKDAIYCGVGRDDPYLEKLWFKTLDARIGKGNPKDKDLWNRFENCMVKKGYIYIYSKDCGRKNSTTDKGICNE